MATAGNTRGPLSSVRRREVRNIGLYALALVVTAVPLASMLVGAWDTQGIGFHLVWGSVRTLDLHIDVAVVFPTGVFVGILIVLWFDDVKRIQAGLLTLGTIPALVALFVWRWGVNIDFTAQIEFFLLGALVGFLASGGHRIITEEPLREFRRAFSGVYLLGCLFIVGSFLEHHLTYNSPVQRTQDGLTVASQSLDPGLVIDGLVLHAIVTVGFVAILREFVRYEDRRDIIVLGPTKSGKTTLVTGLFRFATESDSVRCSTEDGNFELRELYADMTVAGSFEKMDLSDRVESFIPLEFEYMHGNLFSQYMTVRMADYEHELISDTFVDRVRDVSQSYRDRSLIERATESRDDLWPDQAESIQPTELRDRMANFVCESDIVAVVVPMADFVDDIDDAHVPEYYDATRAGTDKRDPEAYLHHCNEILREHTMLGSDRDVIVIVTMTDVAIEAFEQENPGMVVEDYDEFRSYIRNHVFVRNEHGQQLNQYADEVYPFHFEMTDSGDPQLSAEHIYGARELLARIGNQ